MTHNLTALARRAKRLGEALRNVPLFCLAACVSIAIEMFAWGGIFAENHAVVDIAGLQVRLAYAEAIMSISFSLCALVLAGAAAAQKADPRPSQRKRAFATQMLALAVLIAPVFYAGNCLALQSQLAAWREYSGSEAQAADRALAAGESPDGLGVDSIVRAEAAARLARGIRPERAEFDVFATGWIALLLGSNMLAVRLGWRARAETPAEAKARLAAARALTARATRTQNQRDMSNVHKLRRA